MDHIRIFSYFFIFAAGLWTIFQLHQQAKTNSLIFLKPVIVLLIFFNLLIMVNAATVYSCANLLTNCLFYTSSVYSTILTPLFHITFWGMIVSLYYIFRTLKGEEVSKKVASLLAVIMVLIGAYYFVVKIMFNADIRSLGMVKIYRWTNLSAIFLFTLGVIRIIVLSLQVKNGRQRKMILAQGSAYLVWVIFFVITFPMEDTEQVIPNLIMLMLFNLFHLFWYNKFVIPYSAEKDRVIENGTLREKIMSQFTVSSREWDVVELILQGKTNKEIEDSLFISFHTVKNHLYNVYQKFGVKNRSGLIHKINEAAKG